MFRILVPVEEPEPALRAAQHAARMTQNQRDAEIVLLNVQPLALEMGRACAYRSVQALRKLEEEHGLAALSHASRVMKEAGTPYRSVTMVGDPEASICQEAAAEHCNAIVMAGSRRGWLGSLALARLARSILHKTGLAVTLVA